MVARTIPSEEPKMRTRESHPENLEEPREKPAVVPLAHTVSACALCSVVGMAVGTAALSTALQSEDRWETIFLIPLVATTASLLGGWVGAFFYMLRSDASR